MLIFVQVYWTINKNFGILFGSDGTKESNGIKKNKA